MINSVCLSYSRWLYFFELDTGELVDFADEFGGVQFGFERSLNILSVDFVG